jgi:hypothetical protein
MANRIKEGESISLDANHFKAALGVVEKSMPA